MAGIKFWPTAKRVCKQLRPFTREVRYTTARSTNAALWGSSAASLLALTSFYVISTDDDPPNEQYKLLHPARDIAGILAALSRNEASVKLPKGSPIARYDTKFVPSNVPCEDHSAIHLCPATGMLQFGVFDGHAGANASAYVSRTLLAAMADAIAKVSDEHDTPGIAQAITEAYADVEDQLSTPGLKIARKLRAQQASPWGALETAYPPLDLMADISDYKISMTGTCAVTATFLPKARKVIVANVGDSRAVMGSFDPQTGKWQATNLSVDHTGYNEREIERIQSEHPADERDGIIGKGGRILGIAVSRALGDFFFKWPMEFQKDAWSFRDRPLNPKLLTPPYLSAKPEITVSSTQPEGPDRPIPLFIILACDGLWDKLCSHEAVAIIGAHLEGIRGQQAKDDVLWKADMALDSPSSGSIRTKSHLDAFQHIAFKDDNLATHLIRNALGADDAYVAAMLNLPAPERRACRDDVTVQVILLPS